MSGDEEPDYMSDDFLAQCIPQDVRPGLKRVSLQRSILVNFKTNKRAAYHFESQATTDVIKGKVLKKGLTPLIS